MRFTAATVLAFAGAVIAQTSGFDAIIKPGDEETLTAGTTYDIEWDYDSTHPGDVTLTLLGGSSPSTLQQVQVIASDVDSSSGSLSWAIDSSLGTFATYGIQITLDSDSSVFQYSFPFKISQAAAASSSAASSVAVITSSAAASSAAVTTSAPGSVVVTTVIDSTVTDTTDCGSETSTVAAASTSVVGWNTTISSTFSSVHLTTSAYSNWTSSASPNGAKTTKAAFTTVATTPSQTPAAKTSSPAIVVASGAFSLGANSVALIGGLIVAALAL